MDFLAFGGSGPGQLPFAPEHDMNLLGKPCTNGKMLQHRLNIKQMSLTFELTLHRALFDPSERNLPQTFPMSALYFTRLNALFIQRSRHCDPYNGHWGWLLHLPRSY